MSRAVTARMPLSRVLVIGGGQVALLAAIALRRALPHTIVALADAPVAPHALADLAHTTLPSLGQFHARMGMDEATLIGRAAATHRLAIRYLGWPSEGAEWLLAYGAVSEGGVSIGAALAAEEYFAEPGDALDDPLSDLDPALRFDPALHLRGLRSLARHVGVAAGDADDGADLIIDTRAAQAGGSNWIDWSDRLPGRSIAAETCAPALSVIDTVTASEAGYRIASPGRAATRTLTIGYAQPTVDDVPLSQGRIAAGWVDRTVKVGDAAAVFEPLGWCNLHLAICQIELLLELLPGRDIVPLERAEYNRRWALLTDRVADFVAAHHLGRPGIVRSPGLDHTVAEFVRRGRIAYVEEDSIGPDLWRQLLGRVCPQHSPAPIAIARDDKVQASLTAAHRARAARALATASPYPAWLADRLKDCR
ncbi:conserved hypothetical protein [Sphingomonas sp. EC-HK361]|uniref:tryptophan 7-halogenase n=1 Tax=Sphingomonas sp. EC-HK361 TaxID=2038397 RepID=UPI001255B972|nr:tryptophan 7-halogenase [Sphingomonas sp. EC-HK361]VVT22023.1 conserved hypothetical protein [Sphingomonas sp. EC-HK361]